jgi:UDP-N-acetylglucosamine 4,6-dehydratase/5-epimerase
LGTPSCGVFSRPIFGEIRVFSRDEKKQEDMRLAYNNRKLRFYIGDVRNASSIADAMIGVDYVFHAAALKQVPSCEFYPLEALMTNSLGAENVMNAAIQCGVQRVIVSVDGQSRLPRQRDGHLQGHDGEAHGGQGSRRKRPRDDLVRDALRQRHGLAGLGHSAVHQPNPGQRAADSDRPAHDPIHDDDRGRRRSGAIRLRARLPGRHLRSEGPSATIETLATAIRQVLEAANPLRVIGTRHGEKLYETLLTREELAQAEDRGGYFRVPADHRDLNYASYFTEGRVQLSSLDDYNSHNVPLLQVEAMAELLRKLDCVQHAMCQRQLVPFRRDKVPAASPWDRPRQAGRKAA